jgi:glycosyltransferase involved in cell wall biosynthesis
MSKASQDSLATPPRTVLIFDYNNIPTMLSGHSLLALLDHMDPSRYNAVVVFNRPCDAERAVVQRGIETAIIQYGGGNPLLRIWQYGRLPFALWLFLRKIKPALIHANSDIAGRPAIALKFLTGLPVIVHIRNIGLTSRTAPFVLRADHFAAVSNAAAEGTLPHRVLSRTTVVGDGVELADLPVDRPSAQAAARRTLGLPLDCLIVGMAARLSEQKGQRYYIEAARQIIAQRSDVVFIHAGKVPSAHSTSLYERELAILTDGLGAAGKFRWFDYISPIAVFWAAVDIAVLSASGPEAFSRVILEAMAMQRPVISTFSGGPQEIIEISSTGRLVPPGDSKALSGEILTLLSDPDARLRMGASARARVERLFSADLYADKIMELYDKVLNKTK